MADRNLIQNVVDYYNERQEAGDEYRQKAKEAGDRIKQTTASKVVRGAISGPIKAINETVETVDDVYDYFAGNPYDNNDLIDIGKLGLEVEGDKEDWTYTVPQAVTQFLLPMGLVGGATRNVITNPWARGAVAGFVTDAVVQDPYEENLFNMLDEHPRFASPITEILKAKTPEEIGVAEARLRQATGGTLTGEIATGVVLGVRALKKAPKEVQERILKRLMNDENTRLVYAASDDIDNLGDEIIPDVPLTKQEINNRINDLEVEWAIHQRDFKKEFPDVGTVSGIEPSSLPPERLQKYQETVGRHFELRNEISRLNNELKTAPKKLSETLREGLRGLAQSDARALRETDEILKEASELTDLQTKTTGRQKILPGTPHPTDVKKVRGYDGRWVTKKHFDQVTESKKGADKIRAQFDQPVQETFDSPKIGTQIPRGETAQSGAVFIERVDKTNKELIGEQKGIIDKTMARLVLANEQLPKTYDLAVLELQELNAKQLAELGLKKADIAKLTPRKTINLLKKNFDNVRKDLLPGEYRMEGYSESRRKLYKKWFKDDPDVNWVDRQTGKASTIDDEMSIPYLTVKDQPVDAGSGGAVPPRKPPSGSSGADVPPVDPTDPKVQSTFNPKFLPDLDVEKLILDEAEKVKNLDASGQWPYRRTFKDMVNNANQLLPKEVIEQARLFNARYGKGGESDLPATLIAMNQQMNKNATALYDLSKAMDMALSTGNKEGFAELKEQLIRETKVLDGLITLNKPLKTVPAQTLAANKAGGGIANKVATVEDLASRTPAEKAIDQAVDVRGVVDEGGEEAIEQETLRQIIEAAEQGDKPAMKKLRTITKRLQAASGNPEALRRMAQEGPIIKGLRVSNEIFINSILSGPETHAVNILSTALNTVARPIELIVGSGNRQQAMRGAKELMYLTQSIGDSLKMAKAAFRIEDNIINPGAMIQDASRFNVRMDGEGTLANIINTFGTIQRLPSRFLLAEDEFFKSMNFRAYVKASAWENGVNKGLDGKALKDYIQDQFDKTIGIVNEGSMKNTKNIEIADLYEKAQQYAAETTFTADLPSGSFGKKLQGVASHPAGRVIFPFVRTPLNIFKTQVRRTPGVNLILQEYRQALKSSDPSVAARARGEMVIGGAVWSVAGIAAYAINDDFSELAITGGGPSNYDLLNQKKATGWQPYSFRFLKKDENGQPIIGQDGKPKYKYVSFKRLDPWSSFLMMAADSAAITGQLSQQDRDDFGVAASVALGRNITNKTYLQGITELSDLLQKPYKLESWLARRAAATVNPFSSLGRSASKALDPTIMDKRVRPGDEGMVFLRRFHNELAATIPGYGAGMKPIQNFITGSLVEYPPGYGPDIMNIMNPIKETNSLNNSVLTTLVDIGARIEKPKDELFGGIKLNSDQYSDLVNDIAFVKIGGQRMVHALHKTMQRTEVKALLATARGENITAANQDRSVAAQEDARADAEQIFRDIINAYKKAGREQWIRKPENREYALKYDAEFNAINEARSNSVLKNFKQLQGATN